MLRGLVGDSAFFRAIRTYYARYRHGNAMTEDLQREFERAAGRPLTWFFDQWLRRPGHVELTATWRYSPRARRVLLRLRQGRRFVPYRFPLAVEVLDAEGRLCRAVMEVAAVAAEQAIALACPLERAPQAVILDPDVQLLASFTLR
jgi:aminopeptidase N